LRPVVKPIVDRLLERQWGVYSAQRSILLTTLFFSWASPTAT
jgi:hypothetical protein